ncbi:MAG: HupE/UreJ family protein [Raineya sp.]|nr:HupE/UreJ family protein [Raineya sp.]
MIDWERLAPNFVFMDTFQIWFKTGFHHIVGIDAQDHILFLIALCASYFFNDWKKVVLLATAFTIGHTITLILVTLKIIRIDSNLVENWLIPFSIMITALLNVSQTKLPTKMFVKYLIAALFGLVHGAAFSNQLSELLTNNRAEWFGINTQNSGIALPLFAFNVGIEVGQVLIIFIFLIAAFIFTQILRVKNFTWTTFFSGIAFGASVSIWLSRVFEN